MIQVDLQAVANQSLTVTLDGSRYALTIKDAGGIMCADVERDGVILVQGLRAVARAPLLPFPHLQDGNFVLYTENDALPYWTEFGVSQFLFYVSADEIADLAGA